MTNYDTSRNDDNSETNLLRITSENSEIISDNNLETNRLIRQGEISISSKEDIDKVSLSRVTKWMLTKQISL